MSDAKTLLENLNLATMEDGRYGLMADAVIAISNGQISWAGARAALPVAYAKWQRRDLGGRLATPALIDCHTHIVHGGNRANEFEMRLQGATYEDVARAGGGIVSTVTATRKATVDELVESALPRIDALIAEGVAVMEIKSGYGLDVETECNMLRAARQIASLRKVKIVTTFLGAHAIPAEFKGRADEYIDNVCIPALKVAYAQGLVDGVDGFCEGIAFSTDQIRRVFAAAQAMGLPVKLHAEQLSNLHGAVLAAEFGAMSAEHLEYVDEPGVMALAEAGSVAVILPGAFYTLREMQKPPVDLFRKHNVPMAVATDMNPGSSPMTSLLLAMNMACTLFRLTPEEALAGATVHAARALRLKGYGVIAAGSAANIAVWNVKHPAELSYRIGFNPLYERVVGSSI